MSGGLKILRTMFMTRSIGTRYCRGDIWVAKFSYYEDPTQYKMRPVIIISNDMLNESDDVIILAPITSARPRNDYDVVIDYWEDAGLDRASCIRVSKLTSFHKTFLKVKIGTLQSTDLESVLRVASSMFV
ncbi:type II toxin-antitoxin system PemK/MazF family toxin [Paenibacillus phocaensis]